MTYKKKGVDQRSSLERALEDSTIKDRYLKEAEKFFMGSRGRPEHERDIKRLHGAYGKKNFSKVASDYVKCYGLPEEWGALILLLDLKDMPDLVCGAIDRLVEISGDCRNAELRGLESKLRIMEMTEQDPLIQEAAQEALTRL